MIIKVLDMWKDMFRDDELRFYCRARRCCKLWKAEYHFGDVLIKAHPNLYLLAFYPYKNKDKVKLKWIRYKYVNKKSR